MVQPGFANHSGEKLSHPEHSGKLSLGCSHKKARADLTSCECQRGNVPSVPSVLAAPPCPAAPRRFPGLLTPEAARGADPCQLLGTCRALGETRGHTVPSDAKITGWQSFPPRRLPPEPGTVLPSAGVLQPPSCSWLGARLPAPGGGLKALSFHSIFQCLPQRKFLRSEIMPSSPRELRSAGEPGAGEGGEILPAASDLLLPNP